MFIPKGGKVNGCYQKLTQDRSRKRLRKKWLHTQEYRPIILTRKRALTRRKSIMKCTSKPIQLGSLRDFTLTKAFPEQNLKRETVCRICSVIAMQEKSIIFWRNQSVVLPEIPWIVCKSHVIWKTKGIFIYFEKEHIDTGNMDSELMLSIFSSFRRRSLFRFPEMKNGLSESVFRTVHTSNPIYPMDMWKTKMVKWYPINRKLKLSAGFSISP